MSDQITQGKWEVVYPTIISDKRWVVAVVAGGLPNEEAEANARLIAKSKDMLELLEIIYDYADTGKGAKVTHYTCISITDNEGLLNVTRKLLAEIKGEK